MGPKNEYFGFFMCLQWRKRQNPCICGTSQAAIAVPDSSLLKSRSKSDLHGASLNRKNSSTLVPNLQKSISLHI